MFYPVSNKVQITNTHQTSIELDRTADYMFPNTIGFYGISNSVFLPYHYLASDRISGSSYDADTKNTDYKNNKWGIHQLTKYM